MKRQLYRVGIAVQIQRYGDWKNGLWIDWGDTVIINRMEKYEIGRSIGHGSSGQVFLCKYKHQNKFYVVKKFRLFDDDSTSEIRQCIQNQLNFLQRFRHTNIVSYKDNFMDPEGNLYIVMMYCEDGDMGKKIQLTKQKGKTLTETQILDWLIQIALAIYYLHSQNIIHRDIKPQNIFLKNERIRLGDFGIAKMVDSTNLTATCIGTPYYMSPDVLKRKPYSYKSDIWSFGCILYEMCNLRRPFEAQNQFSLSTKIWKGQYASINAIYSKQLRDLIGEMLTVNPVRRPTIIDVLNKPFLRRRLENYIQNILSRNYPEADAEDIFADTLREQALLLKIDLSGNDGSVQQPIKKHPSLKDMNERNSRFNRTKRQNEDDDKEREKETNGKNPKRKSVYKDSYSLEKNIKKEKSTEASSKTGSYYSNDKDEREAFIDHRKKIILDKEREREKEKEKERQRSRERLTNKSIEKRGNVEDRSRQQKRMTENSEEQNCFVQNNSIKGFHFQQDYTMFQEKPEIEFSESSQQSIIPEEDEESIMGNTNVVDQFSDKNFPKQNSQYYKILNQMNLLIHRCEMELSKPTYRRLYHETVRGGDRTSILNIVGTQKIGYLYLADQILYYEGRLKNMIKP